METERASLTRAEAFKTALEVAIRIGLIALLVYWCVLIFLPFMTIILWAVIIAVAVYPLYRKLERLLAGRSGLAAFLFVALSLGLLLVPTVLLFGSLFDAGKTIATGLSKGTLTVPPPSDSIAAWPLIGKPLFQLWESASLSLPDTLSKYGPQLGKLGSKLFPSVAGVGLGVLQFCLSLLIAGLLLAKTEDARGTAVKISSRVLGAKGVEFVDIAKSTIRSVTQGVLGVGAIQSLLAAIGMELAAVPGAGLWALLVLILAVVQLPTILVLGPVILYVFSYASKTVAVIFAIWAILVGSCDTFLKPILMGRGSKIPMLVLLIGALGGMMVSGILGLFVGAVVFSIGYKLFTAWLLEVDEPPPIKEEAEGA